MNETLQNIFCSIHDTEQSLCGCEKCSNALHKLEEAKIMLIKIEEDISSSSNELNKYKSMYQRSSDQEDQWKTENEKLYHQIEILKTEINVNPL